MAAMIKSDFEVIRGNKVYEEVARQIERLILKKLKPGDKLPSEMLEVSRNSIRDAFRGLELIGLVEPDHTCDQRSGQTLRSPATSLPWREPVPTATMVPAPG
jgi:Transcriptional regulators